MNDQLYVALEALIKKKIIFNWSGISSVFASSQALFSSVDIDLGTRALLNTLRKNKSLNYSKVLDLGCGYGVLGIFLKKQDLKREVVLSDRDALACTFSKYNAELNKVEVNVIASLDYENILETDFSLIVTNFPAKMEKEGLLSLLSGASQHLITGGTLALVIVRELIADFEDLLSKLNTSLNLVYKEEKKGYGIYHIQFNEKLNHSITYERSKVKLASGAEIVTARGISEFDTLSYDTEAVIEILHALKKLDKTLINSIALLEPGQGHVAVSIAGIFPNCNKLSLISRDSLALKFSKLNIEHSSKIDCKTYHLPFLEEITQNEFLIWHIVGKNNFSVHLKNAQVLAQYHYPLVIYGEISLLEKLLVNMKVDVISSIKKYGYAAYLVKIKIS